MHDPQDLIAIFQSCFLNTHNTVLVRGGDEPIYYPQTQDGKSAQIIFARGYFSSALHEIAHWLVAGDKRRMLEDYGYWYEPDGRDAQKQALFQQVEIKPQAIEWILSKASGYRFRISNDNLSGESLDSEQFKDDIYQQVLSYKEKGLPERTLIFQEALSKFYKTESNFSSTEFFRSELD